MLSTRRYEGQTVERSSFTVSVEYVCRIVLELPTEVDDQLFALSKWPSTCCQLRVERSRVFVLFGAADNLSSVAVKEV